MPHSGSLTRLQAKCPQGLRLAQGWTEGAPVSGSFGWPLAGLRSSLAGGGDINSLPPIGQVSVGLFETWQLIVLRGTGQGEGQRDREEEEKEEERGGKRKYLR